MGALFTCLVRAIRGAGWAPIAVFGIHVLFARVFAAYRAWPDLDIPVHFAGGAAIAFFFARAIREAARIGILRVRADVAAVCALSLTCTAAVFWEFAEYVSDHNFGTHAQGGLEDTLSDLLMGFLGGAAYVSFAAIASAARARSAAQALDGAARERARAGEQAG
jgi:hypothetical protein